MVILLGWPMVRLICGLQIRRILRTQITVTLPPLWQAAVKDAEPETE